MRRTSVSFQFYRLAILFSFFLCPVVVVVVKVQSSKSVSLALKIRRSGWVIGEDMGLPLSLFKKETKERENTVAIVRREED